MAAGKRTPLTYGGSNVTDTGFTSKFLRDSAIGDVFASEAVTAEVMGAFPTFVRQQPQGRVLQMLVHLTNDSVTWLDLAKTIFKPNRGLRYLTASDANSRAIRLKAAVVRFAPHPNGTDRLYLVDFWVPKPVWQLTSSETDTSEAITASGERWTVTNSGKTDIAPVVIVTPTSYKAAADGPRKFRHVVVANRSPHTLVDALGNPWPIDITNGGWDVETKVKAGELHPSGYDIHVLLDGVEVNRYLSNYGTGYGSMTSAETLFTVSSAAVVYAARFKLPGCSEKETNDVDEVQVAMKKTGSPTGNMTAKIYADGALGPTGSALGTSATVAASGLGTSYAATAFTFASPVTLNAETWYWVVVDTTACTVSASNKIEIGVSSGPANSAHDNIYEGLFYPSAISTDTAATWSKTSGTVARRTIHFRVFVDGTAKIWVPMALAPGVSVEMARSVVASSLSPLTVANAEGTAQMPERGALVLHSATGSECLIYNSKRGTHQVVPSKRGARGTSTGSFDTSVVSGFVVDTDVRLMFDHEAPDDLFKPDFEPRAFAPAIDGVNSTNSEFRWIGPYLAPDAQSRPMAWRTELDDSVELSETVTLDGDPDNDLVDVTFKDAAATGAFLGRNTIVQHFPVGIESGSNITLDEATIAASLQLEHILTNERGEESIAATHRNADQSTGKTVTPADTAFRYRIRARNGNVVAIETADATSNLPQIEVLLATANAGQTITLDESTVISTIGVRMKCGASRTFTATLVILGCDADGVPQHSELLAETSSFTNADVGTSFTNVYKSFTVPARLAAGTYFVGARFSAIGGSGELRMSGANAAYARGSAYHNSNSGTFVIDPRDVWLRVYGEPAAPEVQTGSGDTADIDTIIVPLDDTTPYTPLVVFEASDQDCYYLDAYLENISTIAEEVGVLDEALDASETGVDVLDARPFAGLQSGDPVTILIDSEQMTVTAAAEGVPDSLTVARGANGTSGTTHSAGATIYRLQHQVRLRALMQTGEELSINFETMEVLHSDDDLADPRYYTALVAINEGDVFYLKDGINSLKWTETAPAVTVRVRFWGEVL